MEIGISIENHNFVLHCPSCGKTQFAPSPTSEPSLRHWKRCTNCGFDLAYAYANNVGGVEIIGLMAPRRG